MSYVVTPTGAWCRRIFVVGALTDRSGSGDVMQARVADPTDTFRILARWQSPDVVETLGYIKPPEFVAVTGQASIVGSGPRAYTTITAEAINVVDRTVRDLWIQKVAEMTLNRLDILMRCLSGDRCDRAMMAIDLYDITQEDIRGMMDMVRKALESLRPGVVAEDTLTPLTRQDLLLAALGEGESNRAIPIDEAIGLGVRVGLSAREARRALEELVTAGECYQPIPDTIKLL